ncbi:MULTISPECIES: amidase [Mycobacterium]|uniref:amidase n=1 Tax=Mycobacterium pseudoshottsii TaxID=265949 RepID=A0A9N7QPC4_9MYCO|nr:MULTISPECIES: amidase [Mycobacterium]EPQ46474.1 Putative amidase [Mycobacterium sp. 012931]MBC9863541.1 putative amidase [Mycobacterium pseudoshottsii]BBA89389.1 putative amidase AmiC [Mycobacterium pseudoshottsii JCM 15466]BDN83765.1 putative amidase AmiC [Mycobacterium pseudoshottsii]BEH78150.1 putative amidase AmiC [Mycobacterium pseudoshottsii]
MVRVHAFGDDVLGDLDAVGLADAIRSGQLGAVEVVEAAVARTEAVNARLNGVAHADFDRARDAAQQHGRGSGRGFFGGVPSYIKDNVDVSGLPTMRGTDAWVPRRAGTDSEIARELLSTGLIALGKTQMSEFGFCAAAEHPRLGPVRNPWNTGHTAGASSSGSGALVAAGVVPIAHANDGGGSIRIPASCNGLVGLKPSRGRLPLNSQLRRLPLVIVANGVLTRSVRDTAAIYREVERSWRPSGLPPIGDVTRPGTERLKIAVVTRSVDGECGTEMRELTLKTAGLLEELGHRVEYVEQVPVPESLPDDFILYWGFLATAQVLTGRYSFGKSFDRNRLDSLTLGLARHANRNVHRLPTAVARLRTLRRHTERFFQRYDVVLTPALADPPPQVGYLSPTDYHQVIERLRKWVTFTPLQNVTGDPAISLPLAQSSDGLPVGMMLTADIGREARLLELAYELEEAQPFARIHVPG